ncbi:hypothetical protein QWE_09450 [Agrobacterium albertimagni AOL15]|uniref:Uncharacterized protein n=1 Tax=Agrobacterium albertimagni AOL15 TaxID=1156935 RepID=K2Q7W0_9HYPH|nr:hypothetical protein [Agrobacterium albertimagni]EKF59794.1 hypothetical protein QWE_09450 [Agrobacterium albertimagni AOL15]
MALNELYLEARASLAPGQYRDFLSWSQEMLSTQLPDLTHVPVRYDNLTGITPRAPIIGLQHELRWVAERIRAEAEKVQNFLTVKGIITRYVVDGNYIAAIAALDTLFEAYGATLWSVQLRLALEQQVGGLEQQKKYSAQVRSVYRHGLLGFTTYHTSVRNEERTTITKYLDDIERRISNHSYYDDATRAYMRYRLKNEFPRSPSALSDILRIEQSHGILDVYETFVSILQDLVKEGASELYGVIGECLDVIVVADFRLEKLRLVLNPSITPALPFRPTHLSDALLSGRTRHAIRLTRRLSSTDPWDVIYSAFALASSGKSPRGGLSVSTLNQWIAAAMSCDCENGDYAALAAKLCLNFRGLSVAAGVGEFLAQLRRSRPDDAWRQWIVGLYSDAIGIEDVTASATTISSIFSQSKTSAVWMRALTGSSKIADTAAPSRLATSIFYLSTGCPDKAYDILSSEEPPKPLHAIWKMSLLHALHALGDRSQKIVLVASEGALGKAYFSLFPVVESLEDCAWEDYKNAAAPLAAPIALHLLWTRTENSQTASQLRFATGLVLRRLGVNRPSLLPDSAANLNHEEIFYFLHQVCVPEILDVTRLFSGSREVLEERKQIYLVLSDLRPERAEEFTGEAVLISHNLALDEGRWIVDRTRIHVEDVAFVRWASRELAEDYERYRDLEPVNIEGPQTFEDVLRELDDITSARRSFSPDNEADAVLMSVVRRAGDEFLINSTFGLDFYLAKNVRHHSFIGLIRGPLEVSDLITTRETETSPYHANKVWLNKFQSLDSDSSLAVEVALKTFSARFDEILLDTKDKYFHVRTSEHPAGMLFIPYSDALYSVVRVWLTLELDIETFFRFLINVFWLSLEQSLRRVRELISIELKGALVEEFDKLRALVREVGEADPAFLEFDSEVGKRSAEVQGKLDEAAQWFVHSGAMASQHLFSLEQILEVGLEATLTTQRGYSPRIAKTTIGDLSLDAANLVFVHDVLFVGLGNARKHSGLSSPRIDISARWNDLSSTLTISIVSDCKPSARAENAKRANEVQKLIATGAYSRHTRKDDGSGFAKLAAIVAQSDRGKIEFGFQSDGRFQLEVTYAVLLQKIEQLNA